MAEDVDKMVEDEQYDEMVHKAINIVYSWIKSDEAKDVPPEISITIGILIGHIHKLQAERNSLT